MNPYDELPYGPNWDAYDDDDDEDNAEGYRGWPPGNTTGAPSPTKALVPKPPEPTHWSHGRTWEPTVGGVARPDVDPVTFDQEQFRHMTQIANEFNHQTEYWCPVCQEDCAYAYDRTPKLFHCECCKEKIK